MTEDIEKILNQLGVSHREVKLYLYLAKSGPQKAIEISKNLKIHKVEVYRFLRNLENKGLIESTLERPMRLTAIPFEQVIDSLITERKKTTASLEEKKNEILTKWNLISAEKLPVTSERFVVLSGRGNVYLKILHLVRETQKEVLAITTDIGFMLADQNGFLSHGITEAVEKSRKSQVHARVLTQVTKENLSISKSFSQRLQRHSLSVEIRHLDLETRFAPRLVIRDREEAVVFLTPKTTSAASRDETGLWTNNKTVVYAFEALYQELWRISKTLPERVSELEDSLKVLD